MKYVESITVSPSSKIIKLDTWYHKAEATVCPCDADKPTVCWYSDDECVAAVNPTTGHIYGVSLGTARIYACACDGSGVQDYITVTVSRTVPVERITLNRSYISIEKDTSATLVASIFPEDATDKSLTWCSSNENVASVANGVVCGIRNGTATITATSSNGKSASCTVTVTGDILVTSIELTPFNKTLNVGYSFFPSVTVCPTNATKKSVAWSSANSNIASVNPNSGLVYAKAVGTTTIYATACDGSGVCGCCTVRVLPVYVQDITVCPETLTLDIGESSCLEATVYPVNATNQNISWTSGDCNIADVDANGCVTAKSAGTTYICANAVDGSGVHGCCEVTVNAPVVEDTVPGLKTIKQCRIRTDMSMDDSAILKDSSGANVKLNVGETVPLLSPTNDSNWYRILYNGMMLYVTNDGSFEEIPDCSIPLPEGKTVTVKTDGTPLNVRCTPSTNVEELGQLSNGTKVILTNETPQQDDQGRSWYAVYGQMSNGNYSYGWCWGNHLIEQITLAKSVYQDPLNVRSSYSISSEKVGRIHKGSAVILLEEECHDDGTHVWHKILYNGNAAYVISELSADTDIPNFDISINSVSLTDGYTPSMNVSENGVSFIKDYEGFYAKPYDDGYGNLTIGYGHLILAGESFQSITKNEADILLRNELKTWESRVINYSVEKNIYWSQNQYDAFVSLAFNAGYNFKYVVDFIIDGMDPYEAFSKISYSDGTFSKGLWRRRMDEADIFVDGEYTKQDREPAYG